LNFLLSYQDQTGKFYGYPQTTWIATSVLIIAGPQYTEPANMGLRSIMEIPLSKWFAFQISLALNCLGKAGLSKEHPLIERLLDSLLERQEPNGSWCSEDSGSYNVDATIEALKALSTMAFCWQSREGWNYGGTEDRILPVRPAHCRCRRYSGDVIIYPDRVDGPWWREKGHSLALADLREVLQALPEALVIGQGSYGRMEVPLETRRRLQAAGIEVIVEPTGRACEMYNRLRAKRRVVAALHLTC
jgi:hypothetical protein